MYSYSLFWENYNSAWLMEETLEFNPEIENNTILSSFYSDLINNTMRNALRSKYVAFSGAESFPNEESKWASYSFEELNYELSYLNLDTRIKTLYLQKYELENKKQYYQRLALILQLIGIILLEFGTLYNEFQKTKKLD